MKTVRVLVLMGLACKATGLAMVLATGLGFWWWETAAPAYAAKEVAAEAPVKAGVAGVPADLLERSRGFRDLLEAVHHRGAELEQREQTVAAREAALKTLEKTLADEVTHLEALAKAGGAPAPAGAEGGAAGGGGSATPGVPVTKIYESMKADEAGPIFDKLDDQVALGILSRMKEKQIGAILAAMTRDRAVVITRLLAETGTVVTR